MNHTTRSAVKVLFLSLAFTFCLPSQSQITSRANLHVSEKVAFLHFVDKISGWSPYCGAENVDFGFLGIPKPNEEDKSYLLRYASARKPLGYSSETDLFLWAEQDFPTQGKPAQYTELKAVVEYFLAKSEFREPLARRMHDLEYIAPNVIEELGHLNIQIASLRGVTDVFLRETSPRWNEVPMFLVYTLSAKHSQGGANGDGIFAEVDPSASPKSIFRQCGIYLHEALHHSLCPRQTFIEFTCHGKSRRAKRLCELLKGSAPEERGDCESSMLDEILVYTLSGVIMGSDDPKTEFDRACKEGDKQNARLWDGVQILLPIIRQQIEKPRAKDRFLKQFIDTFVNKVHFMVWKSPCAKFGASPSA